MLLEIQQNLSNVPYKVGALKSTNYNYLPGKINVFSFIFPIKCGWQFWSDISVTIQSFSSKMFDMTCMHKIRWILDRYVCAGQLDLDDESDTSSPLN